MWLAEAKVLAMFQGFPRHGRRPRALSRGRIEPGTARAAKTSAKLLQTAGLHGHKYAIDVTVPEAALRRPGPVAILTSDSTTWPACAAAAYGSSPSGRIRR